ncbi:hypothetical protein [Ferruginibacter sp. HRS2-29]|uniref:hypothetical protein n=1 Tax=Ferruginibacter sp. HRS2-29 TaxID=2487334 RepID=UPI0020CBC5FC|nr:hypothetical protein [Ferruginibacter sp. HRS2-29]MCP9750576.1 hypothetical protein [Ferruginibacter sp. HRS2-29]
MKTLKLIPGTVQLNELSDDLWKHFGKKYTVTDNGRNEIVVAQDATIACKLVLTQKKLLIQGTFPTPGKMLLAMGILLIGGIVIPMAVYLIVYKKKFEAIEKEVYDHVAGRFSR